MKIKIEAIRLLREINGNITYTELKRYVTKRDFLLILMNTPSGDVLLKKLGMYERCIGNDGKTISADDANIVVIDSTIPCEDKSRVLLHEIYHINKHNTEEAFDDMTRIQRDNEAETFAYEVLRLQKHKILYNRCVQIITACIMASTVLLSSHLIYNNPKATQTIDIVQTQHTSSSTPTITANPVETQIPASTKYYAMPAGKVYHKEGCQHINSNAYEVTVEEAIKRGIPPCKTCKPDKP